MLADDGGSMILGRRVRMSHGGTMSVEDARLFLPLGTLVTDQLDDQVIWLLQLDREQVTAGVRALAAHVRELNDDGPEVREGARRGPLYYALLSIRPLQQALAQTDEPEYRKRLNEVLTALRMWEDRAGSDAWHDLPLLLGLCAYPDAMIRERAKARIVLFLAPSLRKPYENVRGRLDESKLSAALLWVRQNRSKLRWDSQAGRSFSVRMHHRAGSSADGGCKRRATIAEPNAFIVTGPPTPRPAIGAAAQSHHAPTTTSAMPSFGQPPTRISSPRDPRSPSAFAFGSREKHWK